MLWRCLMFSSRNQSIPIKAATIDELEEYSYFNKLYVMHAHVSNIDRKLCQYHVIKFPTIPLKSILLYRETNIRPYCYHIVIKTAKYYIILHNGKYITAPNLEIFFISTHSPNPWCAYRFLCVFCACKVGRGFSCAGATAVWMDRGM